jgi:cytochrome b involved in lipid metabolism
MAEAKRRYTGPSDVINEAIGDLNPEKGPMLKNGHVYVVTGYVSELPEEHWAEVTAGSKDKDKE